MAAGRFWVEGPRADPGGLASDLAAFGITDAEAVRFAEDDSAEFPVLPENWKAVTLFLQCATQWRRAGMTAQITGLDYGSVESVMRMTGTKNRNHIFDQIRLIEAGALEADRERQD